MLDNLREEIKTVAFAANQTDAWARMMRSVDLSYEYAHRLIEDGSAAYRLEGEQLRALTSKLQFALIPIAEAIRGEPTGQPPARKSASGVTATAKRARPRNPFTLLASITRRNAHHGKLKVKLHLNRALLRHLATKHKRLTIYIWLRLTLPRKVRPSGVTLIVVKPLTLRRR